MVDRAVEWGHRTGGAAAVFGGGARLVIVAAYAATGLGAAGDRSYGSFSGLTFIPSAALVVAVFGIYRVFAKAVGPVGRLGLLTSIVGLALVAIGQLGGEWLSFPRSGNILIAPGAVLLAVGLVMFAASSKPASVPRVFPRLALSIALLPLVFLPLAASAEVLRGDSFPPSLHDNYFRAMNALGAVLWLAVGLALLHGESEREAGPTGSA